MPVGKGRCARDALPHAFHIGEFKFVFTISTAIKHIYNESSHIIEGCDVACDTNDCWNFPINGASDYHWEYGDTRSP